MFWRHKAETACPHCDGVGVEFGRKRLSTVNQPHALGAHPAGGSRPNARIIETFEITLVCTQCDARFTKMITQTKS